MNKLFLVLIAITFALAQTTSQAKVRFFNDVGVSININLLPSTVAPITLAYGAVSDFMIAGVNSVLTYNVTLTSDPSTILQMRYDAISNYTYYYTFVIENNNFTAIFYEADTENNNGTDYQEGDALVQAINLVNGTSVMVQRLPFADNSIFITGLGYNGFSTFTSINVSSLTGLLITITNITSGVSTNVTETVSSGSINAGYLYTIFLYSDTTGTSPFLFSAVSDRAVNTSDIVPATTSVATSGVAATTGSSSNSTATTGAAVATSGAAVATSGAAAVTTAATGFATSASAASTSAARVTSATRVTSGIFATTQKVPTNSGSTIAVSLALVMCAVLAL